MQHDPSHLAPSPSWRRTRPLRPAAEGLARPSPFSGLLPVTALLVPLIILAVVGWVSWRGVWEQARSDMLRSAETAAEYGQRTLESYSLAAGRVNDRLRGLSDAEIRENEEGLHQALRELIVELTQSSLISVVNAEGRPILSSGISPLPPRAPVTERDYFQALSGPAPPLVHVSQTFLARLDGRLLFAVSRRRQATGNLRGPEAFDGVVTVAVSPLVLAEGLRRLLAEPADRMALVRDDGYGLSTTSGLASDSSPLPRVAPDSPFHGFAAEGARRGIYLSRTAMPGETALLAMRRLDGLPVYAVALRATSAIVAAWWAVMLPHLAFGLPATFVLFLLSLRVWRDQRRLAASNAALRTDRDLSTDRLLRAERFGLVGTFEFDLRSGISRRSPEYNSVHGLQAVATEERHAHWASRLHPDDRERAKTTLRDALFDPAGTADYAQTYRIIRPDGEIRWIAARGEIQRDAQGQPLILLGAHVDVTPLRATELALAESDARLRLAQDAIGIGTWEWQHEARSVKMSRRMAELLGFPPETAPGLEAVLARIHPEDRSRLGPVLKQTRRDGVFRDEVRILRPRDDGGPDTIWVAVWANRMAMAQMAQPRLMGVAYDVTERKRAEELTTLMAHEVEHRAKNALAVVAGLLRMTTADSAAELAQVMEGRVLALSRTITLLGQGRWQGTQLRDILQNELAPFEGDGRVLNLSGPAVLIDVDSAQPLAMALHELATNAAKYGALSVPGGRLAVRWWVEEARVMLVWRESGGPPVPGPPLRMGFGSQLIAMLFGGQIGGQVSKDWEAGGLVCEMSFPLQPPGAA